MPEAMNPSCRYAQFSYDETHLITKFLWKNSVFTAFYAGVPYQELRKPAKIALAG